MQPEQYIPFLATTLGGVIAASAGMGLAWCKRRRDGRDRFLSSIAELEADMPDHCTDLRAFWESTFRPLRLAIYNVQPFISDGQFKALHQIYAEYRHLKEKQLDYDLSELIQAITPKDQPPSLRADALLAVYFDRLKIAVC